MTVLLTLHAAAKLTSSGSTVRSTLPSWTTSGALVVDIGSLRAMTQVISVSLRARGEAHSGRVPRVLSRLLRLRYSSSGHLLHFYRTACAPRARHDTDRKSFSAKPLKAASQSSTQQYRPL